MGEHQVAAGRQGVEEGGYQPGRVFLVGMNGMMASSMSATGWVKSSVRAAPARIRAGSRRSASM
jgi:hypothetical protein